MQSRDKWTSHPRTGAAAFRATARPCVSHGPTTSLAQELQTCGGLLGSLKGVEGPGSGASNGRGPTHQGKCGGEGALGPQWAQRRPLSHHSHPEAGEGHAGLRSWVRSKATTGRREEGQHAEGGLAIPPVLVAQLQVHRGMTVLESGAGARVGAPGHASLPSGPADPGLNPPELGWPAGGQDSAAFPIQSAETISTERRRETPRALTGKAQGWR